LKVPLSLKKSRFHRCTFLRLQVKKKKDTCSVVSDRHREYHGQPEAREQALAFLPEDEEDPSWKSCGFIRFFKTFNRCTDMLKKEKVEKLYPAVRQAESKVAPVPRNHVMKVYTGRRRLQWWKEGPMFTRTCVFSGVSPLFDNKHC
jgi:hypothetical protein